MSEKDEKLVDDDYIIKDGENLEESEMSDELKDLKKSEDSKESEASDDELEQEIAPKNNDKPKPKPTINSSSQAQTAEPVHHEQQTYSEQPKIIEPKTEKLTVREWLNKQGWFGNPFTFGIYPSLLVGYKAQLEAILNSIEEKHKISVILGPTGSGKTTLTKWVSNNLPKNCTYIYLGKSPEKSEEFVGIFNDKFRPFWLLRPFVSKLKTLYQIPQFLNKRLKDRYLVIFCDEVHETNLEVLEWLRVLSDQVDNMMLVLSGLPVFEGLVNEKLETFEKRISTKIELLSLTKEDTLQLIKKRIENVGGKGIEPFSSDVVDMVYSNSGGFPREIIRLCNDLLNKAINEGKLMITPDMLESEIQKEITSEKPEHMSFDVLDKMTPMQKEVIEFLAKKPMTPGQIANSIDLEKYKSRQHAVRSVNNILKMLLKEGVVERRKNERAFSYHLSTRIKTMLVKA